jgi:hypothetical protein
LRTLAGNSPCKPEWKRLFADRFAEYYKDWLPADRTAIDVLNLLRIPYIPFWSFGESLPVVVQGTSDPSSLGAAYEVLGRLIETDLEWTKVLSGEIRAAPVSIAVRTPKEVWLGEHHAKALEGVNNARRHGFMDVLFYITNSLISKPQDELLSAARRATTHTFGWPIGVVLDGDERPRATNDGIFAETKPRAGGDPAYEYWALTTAGDFYSLLSLIEDDRDPEALFVDTRIARTAEALLYCARLYRNLGASANATIRFTVSYTGIKGRELSNSVNFLRPPRTWQNLVEDRVAARVDFLWSGTL